MDTNKTIRVFDENGNELLEYDLAYGYLKNDRYKGEKIFRYVHFTAKELAERRIIELKLLLRSTDYNILKIVEGESTLTAMAAVIKKRASWRKEINELESKIGDKNGA